MCIGREIQTQGKIQGGGSAAGKRGGGGEQQTICIPNNLTERCQYLDPSIALTPTDPGVQDSSYHHYILFVES